MPSLGTLPNELMLNVAAYSGNQDLSSLSRVCRGFHNLLTPALYERHKNDGALLYCAVELASIGTIRYLLQAGANPNIVVSTRFVKDPSEGYPSLHRSNPNYKVTTLRQGFGYQKEESPAKQLEQHRLLGRNSYWSPLHAAVGMGRDDIVQLLLEYGADIHAFCRGFCTCTVPSEKHFTSERALLERPTWMPLHVAICYGHESTARLLISRGASIDVSAPLLRQDACRINALHTACSANAVPIIRFLLDEGHQQNVNVLDPLNSTPITYAYAADNWSCIEPLAGAGGSLDATLDGDSLIQHACRNNRFDEAIRFIHLGADLKKSSNEGLWGVDIASAALFLCCDVDGRVDARIQRNVAQKPSRILAIRALIEAGADIETRCQPSPPFHREKEGLITPLMAAAGFGLPEVVNTLIAVGADIGAVDKEGKTALILAARDYRLPGRDGHEENESMLNTIAALLPHKPGRFDEIHKALLKSLSNCSDIRIPKLLLKHAKPGILGEEGNVRPLLEAAMQNDQLSIELAEWLTESGLREPTTEEIAHIIDALIPIDICPTHDELLIVEYFLRYPHAHDVVRNTNRIRGWISQEDTYTELVKLAIELGLPDDCPALLVEACEVSNEEIVQLLLEKGADPNEPSGSDLPLLKSFRSGGLGTVRILMDHGAIVHKHPKVDIMGRKDFGPLDLAITRGEDAIVRQIVTHRNYQATREQSMFHFETACFASRDAFGNGTIFKLLLEPVGSNAVLPQSRLTPLHLLIRRRAGRGISLLIEAGADIHIHLSPSDSSSIPVNNSIWGTTALEWAIKFSPVQHVRLLLETPSNAPRNRSRRAGLDVYWLRYVHAACRRNDPAIMDLLLKQNLPAHARNDKGNSFLTMFCTFIYNVYVSADPTQIEQSTVDNSAECVVVLLNHGADPEQKNNKGVSGRDLMCKIVFYDGPSLSLSYVANAWCKKLVFDNTGVRVKS
ncbi:ankyrin [Daldinia sp. FL1419]|nr:ankyrin [Daldinia sp. FL1419]